MSTVTHWLPVEFPDWFLAPPACEYCGNSFDGDGGCDDCDEYEYFFHRWVEEHRNLQFIEDCGERRNMPRLEHGLDWDGALVCVECIFEVLYDTAASGNKSKPPALRTHVPQPTMIPFPKVAT